MSSKTLEQYLVAAIERGQIDHVIRASRAPSGKITFYVRPLSGDGETLDFVVRGNALVLNLTSDSDVPEIPKHPSHPDVPRPSDAELVELARGVCHAIEACGASPELTKAVTLASDLVAYLQKPAAEGAIVSTSVAQPNPVHLAVDLGHAIGRLAETACSLGQTERGQVSLLIKSMTIKATALLSASA